MKNSKKALDVKIEKFEELTEEELNTVAGAAPDHTPNGGPHKIDSIKNAMDQVQMK